MDRRLRLAAMLAACVMHADIQRRGLRLRDHRHERLEPDREHQHLGGGRSSTSPTGTDGKVSYRWLDSPDKVDRDLGQPLLGLGAARQSSTYGVNDTSYHLAVHCGSAGPVLRDARPHRQRAGLDGQPRREGAAMSATRRIARARRERPRGRGDRRRGGPGARPARAAGRPPLHRRPATPSAGRLHGAARARAGGAPAASRCPPAARSTASAGSAGGDHRADHDIDGVLAVQRRLPVAARLARRPRRPRSRCEVLGDVPLVARAAGHRVRRRTWPRSPPRQPPAAVRRPPRVLADCDASHAREVAYANRLGLTPSR